MSAPDTSTTAGLTSAQRELLEFERAWWKYLGARDTAIRERFGISPTIYSARIVALLRDPAAEAYDPELVRRLRRLSGRRRDQRTAATRGVTLP